MKSPCRLAALSSMTSISLHPRWIKLWQWASDLETWQTEYHIAKWIAFHIHTISGSKTLNALLNISPTLNMPTWKETTFFIVKGQNLDFSGIHPRLITDLTILVSVEHWSWLQSRERETDIPHAAICLCSEVVYWQTMFEGPFYWSSSGLLVSSL